MKNLKQRIMIILMMTSVIMSLAKQGLTEEVTKNLNSQKKELQELLNKEPVQAKKDDKIIRGTLSVQWVICENKLSFKCTYPGNAPKRSFEIRPEDKGVVIITSEWEKGFFSNIKIALIPVEDQNSAFATIGLQAYYDFEKSNQRGHLFLNGETIIKIDQRSSLKSIQTYSPRFKLPNVDDEVFNIKATVEFE